MSSRGELTKGDPPDWSLNKGTKPPHLKIKSACCKMLHRASDLEISFGMT